MSSDPTQLHSLPYEFRIGVTGHRDLGDPAAVRSAVDALLEQLHDLLSSATEFPFGSRSAHGSKARNARWWLARCLKIVWRSMPLATRHVAPERRTRVDWTIVSSLAAGADRIVAEAVLDNERFDGQRRFETVLPLEQSDYEKDFAGDADLNAFRRLLSRADETTELRSPQHDSPSMTSGEARRRAYLRAGRAVVDTCEILIAVWDGDEKANGVGTAAIVRYAVERNRFVLWVDANDPSKPVLSLVADDASPRGWRALPIPNTAKELSRSFHSLAAYNRDSAHDSERAREIVAKEAAPLREAAAKAGLSADCIAPLIQVLLPHFARADQLAARYQSLYTSAARWLYGLAAVAVTIPVLQLLFLPDEIWIIGFEVLTLLVILALLEIGRHDAWHAKWLQDRHLAERLRTAMFMVLVDVAGPRRAQPLERFLPFYDAVGAWVGQVATRLTREASKHRCEVDRVEPLREFVLRAWIDGQTKHQRSSVERHRGLSHRAHRVGVVLFVVTLVAASLHAVGVGHVEDVHELSGWAVLGFMLIALSIALPAWGVAVHAINGMLDRDRIGARAQSMCRILQYEISRDIEQAVSFEELRDAVERAGELLQRENYEWLTSLAFQDLHRPG
jgi:hypothetical protein